MALLNRNEVKQELCWDLSTIFPSREEALAAAERLAGLAEQIESAYKGRLNSAERVIDCLGQLEQYEILAARLCSYGELLVSTDYSDQEAIDLDNKVRGVYAACQAKLSFLELELGDLPEAECARVCGSAPRYAALLRRIMRDKKYRLQSETEFLISKMLPLSELPYTIYNAQMMGDLRFEDFEVDGKTYPLDQSLQEDHYEHLEDTAVRRAASRSFYDQLRRHQNVTAAAYNGLVTAEKSISEMRGHRSVFAYLLHDQEISEEVYNKHLDTLMEELAPHMRRYAKLIQKSYSLDRMTYADLKLPLPFQSDISAAIEDGREYIKAAFSVMGPAYTEAADRLYRERRIDFAQNAGKTAGAFCAPVYGCGEYILCTWQDNVSNLFTVAHELGHAVHFDLLQSAVSVFDADVSPYLTEAPSTFCELLLTDWLTERDPSCRGYVLSSLVGHSFYHNFVTHFLEAYYQREVYRLVDRGESVSAETLSRLFRSVLEKFWGDAVELTDGCELTWMRQPHYYMGLYPYTYSASLSVAVAVWKRMKEDPGVISKWMEFLKTGLTKSPVEAAGELGVDIASGEHVTQAIAAIGEMIDTLCQLLAEK